MNRKHFVIDSRRYEHEIMGFKTVGFAIDVELTAAPTNEVEHGPILIFVGQFPGRFEKIAEIHAARGSQAFKNVT